MSNLEVLSPDSRKFPFPLAIPIVALFLSWIIGKRWPIEANWPTWTQWAGWILLTVPFLFAIWAIITFRRNFTVVDPRGQVTTIVTTFCYFQYSFCCSMQWLFRRRNISKRVLERNISATGCASGVGCECPGIGSRRTILRRDYSHVRRLPRRPSDRLIPPIWQLVCANGFTFCPYGWWYTPRMATRKENREQK